MGKRNKNKKNKEIIDTYKQIQNLLKEEELKDKKTFSFQQKKVKMPYKMYHGIKQKVINKYKKELEYNKQNDIIAQSNTNQKFMTKHILEKYNQEKEKIKKKKLLKSRNIKNSQLKGGILKLPKNFKDKIKP